jgi:hypothetical protein
MDPVSASAPKTLSQHGALSSRRDDSARYAQGITGAWLEIEGAVIRPVAIERKDGSTQAAQSPTEAAAGTSSGFRWHRCRHHAVDPAHATYPQECTD